MIDRVVENWLTRANERQYQFPFCQVLIAKGFRIFHLSSHGPQEQGKDIIALDKRARPIGFQLKTGDIDLSALRKIHGELNELVEVPIQFPGFPRRPHHRSVLVTNGMLNDPARQTLSNYVQGWESRGFPRLQVELKDSLLRDFVDLHGKYLPSQLSDVVQLLRFYTRDGLAPRPRAEFAGFVANNVLRAGLSSVPTFLRSPSDGKYLMRPGWQHSICRFLQHGLLWSRSLRRRLAATSGLRRCVGR